MIILNQVVAFTKNKQTNKQTNKQMLVRNVSFFIAHLSKLLANVKTISMAILNI